LLGVRATQALGLRDAVRETDEVRSQFLGTPLGESSDRLCGAPGCSNAWIKPWKSRERPVFEDDWACSARCLREMVEAAVRREVGDGYEGESEAPHHHRVPLGLVLLAQGWITQPQLQHALAAQRANGQGRIGDWLNKGCGLPEDRIVRALGVQWNCPVLSLQGFSPNQMALVMPKRFVSEFGMLPVRAAGSKILYVAFPERVKPETCLALEHMCHLKVESGLLTETQMKSARGRMMAADAVPVYLRKAEDCDDMTESIVKLIERRLPVMTRFVRIHQYYWLRMWLEESAIPLRGALQSTAEDTEDHVFLME
jgi:hypothetical protein